MEEFTLYEDYKLKEWNINFQFSFITLVFALLLLVLQNVLNETILKYFAISLATLFFISFILEIRSYFSKYESTKGIAGKLKIEESRIIWNDKPILWINIIDFKIQYNEIAGEHQMEESGYQNNVSDGFNEISLKTKNGLEFKGHYHLKSKNQLKSLENLLWSCIVSNQINYDLSKKIVQPKNYLEHQKLKQRYSDAINN